MEFLFYFVSSLAFFLLILLGIDFFAMIFLMVLSPILNPFSCLKFHATWMLADYGLYCFLLGLLALCCIELFKEKKKRCDNWGWTQIIACLFIIWTGISFLTNPECQTEIGENFEKFSQLATVEKLSFLVVIGLIIVFCSLCIKVVKWLKSGFRYGEMVYHLAVIGIRSTLIYRRILPDALIWGEVGFQTVLIVGHVALAIVVTIVTLLSSKKRDLTSWEWGEKVIENIYNLQSLLLVGYIVVAVLSKDTPCLQLYGIIMVFLFDAAHCLGEFFLFINSLRISFLSSFLTFIWGMGEKLREGVEEILIRIFPDYAILDVEKGFDQQASEKEGPIIPTNSLMERYPHPYDRDIAKRPRSLDFFVSPVHKHGFPDVTKQMAEIDRILNRYPVNVIARDTSLHLGSLVKLQAGGDGFWTTYIEYKLYTPFFENPQHGNANFLAALQGNKYIWFPISNLVDFQNFLTAEAINRGLNPEEYILKEIYNRHPWVWVNEYRHRLYPKPPVPGMQYLQIPHFKGYLGFEWPQPATGTNNHLNELHIRIRDDNPVVGNSGVGPLHRFRAIQTFKIWSLCEVLERMTFHQPALGGVTNLPEAEIGGSVQPDQAAAQGGVINPPEAEIGGSVQPDQAVAQGGVINPSEAEIGVSLSQEDISDLSRGRDALNRVLPQNQLALGGVINPPEAEIGGSVQPDIISSGSRFYIGGTGLMSISVELDTTQGKVINLSGAAIGGSLSQKDISILNKIGDYINHDLNTILWENQLSQGGAINPMKDEIEYMSSVTRVRDCLNTNLLQNQPAQGGAINPPEAEIGGSAQPDQAAAQGGVTNQPGAVIVGSAQPDQAAAQGGQINHPGAGIGGAAQPDYPVDQHGRVRIELTDTPFPHGRGNYAPPRLRDGRTTPFSVNRSGGPTGNSSSRLQIGQSSYRS